MAKPKNTADEEVASATADEEDDVDTPIRLKAAAGSHSGVMHVNVKGRVKEVRVEAGVTEAVSPDVAKALAAYGYRVIGG